MAVEAYDQVEKIHYDDTTYTEYNNIDRKYSKYSSGYSLGHTTLLSFYRDGELLRTIKVKNMDLLKTRGLTNDIWYIEYLDKDRVWLFSLFERHLSQIVLYNTLTDKNDAHYSGKHPLISPDKRHVAYTVPSGYVPSPDYVDHAFIDNVMVYPEVVYDITLEKINYSKRDDASHFWEFRPENLKSSWIGENFKWSKDGKALTILANEKISNDEGDAILQYKKILVKIDETAVDKNPETSVSDQSDAKISARAFSVDIEEAVITESEFNDLKK